MRTWVSPTSASAKRQPFFVGLAGDVAVSFHVLGRQHAQLRAHAGVLDHFVVVIHAVHPENQKLRRDFEEDDFQARKLFKNPAENQCDQRRDAVERAAEDMHREKVSLAVDQRADVAERAWMAKERDIELLCGLVKRKESRIVHLLVFGIAHQVGGFAAQIVDAMSQLVGISSGQPAGIIATGESRSR